MAESSPTGWKTLREEEELLVTSNFSFSRSGFKRLVLQTRKNQGLFGKGLKLHHAMTDSESPEEKTKNENIVGRREKGGKLALFSTLCM